MSKNLSIYVLALVAISLFSCKKKADPAVMTSEGPVAETVGDATYMVNTEASTITWEGFKLASSHNGTVNIKEGTVDVVDGKVNAGSFIIDMNTINDLDLEGDKKASIEAHLKGTGEDGQNDFFNVTKYPTSKFEITKVVTLQGEEENTTNSMVYGNLTIKDKTNQIGFKANIEVTEKTVKVTAPKFMIDRTKWGITFKSASAVADMVKENAINDDMAIGVSLIANRK